MNDSEEPIYDFSALKSFLINKGFTIGTRHAYEAIKPEDIKPEDVTNGKMEFRNDGIFVLGSDSKERQVFLYKKDYRMQQFGKPRFHICKCEIIDDFIMSGRFRQHYVRANSEPVPVKNIDNRGIKEEVTGLPLCRFCKEIISNVTAINSTQFVELLKSANGDNQDKKKQETNLFGYTRDWEYISKEYREKHNYTCENCGLKIEDDYDKQFMHVHHISGDKTNNNESNLKCLCLYCHAHVDDNHYRRLTRAANKISYYNFVLRYYDEGFWDVDEKIIHKAQTFMEKLYSKQRPINITIENHYHGTIDNLTINNDK